MYGRIIEFGIIALLIVTPLAFGSVMPPAIALIEILSGILLMVLVAKNIANRQRHRSFSRTTSHNPPPLSKNHMFRIFSPLFLITITVFLGFILFQLMPLPAILVKLLSPATYRLYAEAASTLTMAVPSWLSLSVCPRSTTAEFLKIFAYIAVFFLVINTVRRTKQVKRLLYVILSIGFFEAFYGLLQFVSGQYRIYSYQIHSAWVGGTFVNKNHFAGCMELIIPLGFGLLLTRFEKRKAMSYTLEEKYMKGIFVVFAIFVMLCGLFLSGSRGGIISFLIGTGCFILLTSTRQLLYGWVMILLLVLSLALGIFVAVNPEFISERLGTLAELESDQSFRVRWELWKSAFHIFQDYPFVGSGLGTYTNLFRKYKTFRWNLDFNYPENDYVQLLAETGILGVGLTFLLGAVFLVRTLSAWKRQQSQQWVGISAGGLSAMLSLAVHSAVDFNLHIPSNALLFSVVAALTYISARMRQSRHPESTKTHHESSDTGTSQTLADTRHRSYHHHNERRNSIFPGIVIGLLALAHLLGSARMYAAFTHSQQAKNLLPSKQDNVVPLTRHNMILHHLRAAIRSDPQNAAYAFTLGSYLYQPPVMEHQAGGFDEAEHWLRKASMLDPANPWYPYEMGLLSYARGDCHDWDARHPNEPWDTCLVSRYLLAALANAPKNTFLRQAVGRWYAFDDRATAVTLIRRLLADDNPDVPIDRTILDEFSEFLYDLGMDYESDQERRRAVRPTATERSQPSCQLSIISQAPGLHHIELGNDDGSAEWSTRLNANTMRVKKVICLPETLEPYNTAMLRIFLNHAGNPDFTMQVALDDQPVKALPPLPAKAQWYEIPLELSLLAGKTDISVYIRVSGASEARKALYIWGDQDTPMNQSVLDLNTTRDLSPDDGRQTGEYMIRLVLKGDLAEL